MGRRILWIPSTFQAVWYVNVQKQECRHNHTCLDSVGASPVLFHFRKSSVFFGCDEPDWDWVL